jgi:hypothetical protein
LFSGLGGIFSVNLVWELIQFLRRAVCFLPTLASVVKVTIELVATVLQGYSCAATVVFLLTMPDGRDRMRSPRKKPITPSEEGIESLFLVR